MSVSRDPLGSYHDHLASLHDQFRIAQIAMYRQNRKAIIALEGYDASGKGGVIRELSYAWDPRGFEVYPIGPPAMTEAAHPFYGAFGIAYPLQVKSPSLIYLGMAVCWLSGWNRVYQTPSMKPASTRSMRLNAC